ncbi:hypothetical protein HBN50_04720 [Halobacteriovorax sp. GB3]|uniref:hypothetical protein n=1 Tax=Halobacteriovorax sp. GB3 TaxID=2719615 RepID=UPI00235FFEB2|nr:hypothetical protein [Halobacteriovorax sp. GB3]MDD0852387.1 hypothetical protein [Halobacteriovorax sp. GB3]
MNVVNRIILFFFFSSSVYASCLSTMLDADLELKIRIDKTKAHLFIKEKVKAHELIFDCWNEDQSLRCSGDDDGGLFYLTNNQIEIHALSTGEDGFQYVPEKVRKIKMNKIKCD